MTCRGWCYRLRTPSPQYLLTCHSAFSFCLEQTLPAVECRHLHLATWAATTCRTVRCSPPYQAIEEDSPPLGYLLRSTILYTFTGFLSFSRFISDSFLDYHRRNYTIYHFYHYHIYTIFYLGLVTFYSVLFRIPPTGNSFIPFHKCATTAWDSPFCSTPRFTVTVEYLLPALLCRRYGRHCFTCLEPPRYRYLPRMVRAGTPGTWRVLPVLPAQILPFRQWVLQSLCRAGPPGYDSTCLPGTPPYKCRLFLPTCGTGTNRLACRSAPPAVSAAVQVRRLDLIPAMPYRCSADALHCLMRSACTVRFCHLPPGPFLERTCLGCIPAFHCHSTGRTLRPTCGLVVYHISCTSGILPALLPAFMGCHFSLPCSYLQGRCAFCHHTCLPAATALMITVNLTVTKYRPHLPPIYRYTLGMHFCSHLLYRSAFVSAIPPATPACYRPTYLPTILGIFWGH